MEPREQALLVALDEAWVKDVERAQKKQRGRR